MKIVWSVLGAVCVIDLIFVMMCMLLAGEEDAKSEHYLDADWCLANERDNEQAL